MCEIGEEKKQIGGFETENVQDEWKRSILLVKEISLIKTALTSFNTRKHANLKCTLYILRS